MTKDDNTPETQIISIAPKTRSSAHEIDPLKEMLRGELKVFSLLILG
jgi:hypothetical protein